MTESEVWKDIVDYEGYYQVSNKGNVRSIARKDSIGRKCGGVILKPSLGTSGYLEVKLYKNGKRKGKLIHRLVLEAFVENPNNLPEVNHLDENKANNELPNLEWCTSEYNSNHGTRVERLSKRVRAVNVETGEILRFNSTAGARRNGYHKASQACRGVYKNPNGKLIGDGRTYKGHRWYYEEEGE